MYSKADTHIHTTFSDGFMTPEEVVEFVGNNTDLKVIAITDHDTAEGAFVARAYARRHAPHLEVIIGEEISTREGDVIGLYLKSTLPTFQTAAEAIEAIHAQGGLAVAVHPFSRLSTLNNMKGIGPKVFDLPLDGLEVCNGFPGNLISNRLTRWLNRHKGQNLPELGGSDSHVTYTIGQPFTLFPGSTAADFREALEKGAVRVGGTLWKPANVLRLISLAQKRGMRYHEPVFTE